MAVYVKLAAIDAVINGNEVSVPAAYVPLQDATTGYDGPGSYHIQLVAGAAIGGGPGYKATYGLAPSDTSSAMTVLRVVLTPTGQLVFNDTRKLNVGNTGVNATIAQSAFSDGSYLKSGVVTTRALASGFTPIVAHGTAFPSSPVNYELFYRDDLTELFVYDPVHGWIGSSGSGAGGTPIAFSSSATGTNWNPQGGSSVASSYFKSMASFTPPSRPYLLRLRGIVQVDASASDTYYGIALSSDGTHFIAADCNLVGSVYAEAYYGTVSSAGGGSIYTAFQAGAMQCVLIELNVLVTSSSIAIVGATFNNTPVFGSGSFGQKTAFEVTSVDLTTAFYFYAIGANVGNMIAAAYTTSLF